MPLGFDRRGPSHPRRGFTPRPSPVQTLKGPGSRVLSKRNADPSTDGREAEVSDGRKGTKRPEPGELADLGRRFRGHGDGNPIPALPYAKNPRCSRHKGRSP